MDVWHQVLSYNRVQLRDKTIIDIGSGTGVFSLLAASHVYALEPSVQLVASRAVVPRVCQRAAGRGAVFRGPGTFRFLLVFPVTNGVFRVFQDGQPAVLSKGDGNVVSLLLSFAPRRGS
jgi:hypothetical protein